MKHIIRIFESFSSKSTQTPCSHRNGHRSIYCMSDQAIYRDLVQHNLHSYYLKAQNTQHMRYHKYSTFSWQGRWTTRQDKRESIAKANFNITRIGHPGKCWDKHSRLMKAQNLAGIACRCWWGCIFCNCFARRACTICYRSREMCHLGSRRSKCRCSRFCPRLHMSLMRCCMGCLGQSTFLGNQRILWFFIFFKIIVNRMMKFFFYFFLIHLIWRHSKVANNTYWNALEILDCSFEPIIIYDFRLLCFTTNVRLSPLINKSN